MSYTVGDFAAMFADRVRVDAYLAAMAKAITPGSVVCDLGTGTGFFAIAACRLGARKVYAIDTNDAIQLARELAVANGYADRIELIHASSLDVTLPERVDVLVSDLRGALPVFSQGLPSIADARRRFLKPGGIQIPLRDVIRAVPVESPEIYRKHRAPWGDQHADMDLRPIERALLHSWGRDRVTERAFIAEPAAVATIDHLTVESAFVSGRAAFVATRAATGHGIQVWFDAELAAGIGFTTAPTHPEAIYGTAWFPWLEPVPLEAGDGIELRLDAHLVGDSYIWRWRTRVIPTDRTKTPIVFDQSTFFSTPIPSDLLARRAAEHRTELSDAGLVDHLVLGRMAEGALVGDIAREIAARWPARFTSADDALAHVGVLSGKYGR